MGLQVTVKQSHIALPLYDLPILMNSRLPMKMLPTFSAAFLPVLQDPRPNSIVILESAVLVPLAIILHPVWISLA